MKKFVFLYCGPMESTPKVQEAWGNWFASIGDKLVDSGSPLGPGIEISLAGTKELPVGLEAITGYSIINADNLNEAEKIAKGCPTITSLRVYEARAM